MNATQWKIQTNAYRLYVKYENEANSPFISEERKAEWLAKAEEQYKIYKENGGE